MLPTKEQYYLPGETSPLEEIFLLMDLGDFSTAFNSEYRLTKLDVKYVFEALLTQEDFDLASQVNRNIYKSEWIADFYVSFIGTSQSEIPAYSAGLWGAYFGFDLAFATPENIKVNPTGERTDDYFEIPLLGFMGMEFTYEDICTQVQVFRCGAFNLDPLNAGITMNVELRLTNPNDYNDFLSVCSYQHTFTTEVQEIYNVNDPDIKFGMNNYPYK